MIFWHYPLAMATGKYDFLKQWCLTSLRLRTSYFRVAFTNRNDYDVSIWIEEGKIRWIEFSYLQAKPFYPIRRWNIKCNKSISWYRIVFWVSVSGCLYWTRWPGSPWSPPTRLPKRNWFPVIIPYPSFNCFTHSQFESTCHCVQWASVY